MTELAVDDVDGWLLSPDEQELVKGRTGVTRLGFAVLLRFFDINGRFATGVEEISEGALSLVAAQVGVENPAVFGSYRFEGRTYEAHRAVIRNHFGFRESTTADLDDLASWVATEPLRHGLKPGDVHTSVLARCRELRLEPPSNPKIDRLIGSGQRQFNTMFCQTVTSRLTPATIESLSDLAAGTRWQDLRQGPGRASVDTVITELTKLDVLTGIDLPGGLFDGFPDIEVTLWGLRAASETPTGIARHDTNTRTTLLAAFVQVKRSEIVDDLIDLLITIVHKIGARAERKVTSELSADLKRVNGKTGLLFRVAQACLDQPDGVVSEVLYPVVGEQRLRALVAEYKADGPAYRNRTRRYLRASYKGHYRRCLPKLLSALVFDSSNTTHRPVIEAIELVCRYSDTKLQFYPDYETVPITGVVPAGWTEFVVPADSDGDGRVSRVNYEIAVMQTLRDRLRCKEIWVHGARRWRNPDEDLPADFDDRRVEHYNKISKPLDSGVFIADVKHRLTDALTELNDLLTSAPDGDVKIGTKRGGWITLTPLVAHAEPPTLDRLRGSIETAWGSTSLLDMFKETALRTGALTGFSTTGTRSALNDDQLTRRLMLCIYALGTNTGIHRVASGGHGETETSLRYVQNRYLTPVNLRSAISAVVNATLAERDPALWGTATTCASDSTKFGAWDQNLLTEWHARYRGPGVMIYWHVAKRALCVHSQLKSCSSSEAAAAIEGIVRHSTNMKLDGYYTDSHGQTEVTFAFSELLGYQLLPRLKRIGPQRLYTPGANEKHRWPALTPVLTRPINWDLIADQYDQMVRYTTAIRVGSSDAESILRRFNRTNVTHPTYRALAELGKAIKTIFLANYLSRPDLRREINEGLNIVEHWNSVNGFIFFGKHSNITSNRRDQQELSMLCLHLLQSSLVYINTLMVQETLSNPSNNLVLTPEDYRGITPLFYRHVNPYGEFNLDMGRRIALA